MTKANNPPSSATRQDGGQPQGKGKFTLGSRCDGP